jgi:hypothetical protein
MSAKQFERKEKYSKILGGELCVASFLVSYFKRGLFQRLVAENPMPGCTLRYRCHRKAGQGQADRSERRSTSTYRQMTPPAT